MNRDFIVFDDIFNAIENLKKQNIKVQSIITSPPYWGLRNYGIDNIYEIGKEETIEEYIKKIVNIFDNLKNILKNDGTLWLNLGDFFVGTGDKKNYQDPKFKNGRNGQKIAKNKKVGNLKRKNLFGLAWKIAFALQENGWILRQDIIWNKENSMPEPVKDRCSKSHEYLFMFSKKPKYFYNQLFEKTKDGNNNKNMRSVWNINLKPLNIPKNLKINKHIAVFPLELVEKCILASTKENDIILDPFFGSGTSGVGAKKLNRNYIGIELYQNFKEIQDYRLSNLI